MKYYLLICNILALTACVPFAPQQIHSNNMMNHCSGASCDDQSQTEGILPSQGQDITSLPEAKPSQILDVQNGQMISLNPTIVRKTIRGKEIAMYGYNGEIPGPLLRVKQGASFTVNVRNNIDLPTTIHWHGIRVNNANDGVPDVTQKEIKPGSSFTYIVKVPDEGIYWYHTHVREDVQQPMGLYGNVLVTPADPNVYNPVNREEVLAVSDLLVDENGAPIPFGKENADHTLMGRFGNVMLVNGNTDDTLHVSKGEVVRFYLTDVANTRTFKINFGGAKMKLIGGDSGRYEKEQFVDSVIISPSERVIVDVLFEKSGTFPITHRTPDDSYTLGTVNVTSDIATPSYAKSFASLTTHEDIIKEIDTFRPFFTKPIDKTIVLDMDMMGNSAMVGHGGMMMSDIHADGIEWEDSAGMMNTSMMSTMMKWKLVDLATGAANENLKYTAKVGDKVKIRIINKKNSAHPMQHPIHFHGQRFLVLLTNGIENKNLVWKDTVLVPAGQTVDILLDASNPGDWMFHCHIAEHLNNGMMGMFTVLP